MAFITKHARTVQDGAGIDVCIELPLRIGEQGQIQFLLFGAEVVTSDDDRARWQSKIVGTLDLQGAHENESRRRGEGRI